MKKMQRGLSLVELMVALLLSSFLILGITQIYISNKKTYMFQQGQAANLDNSRFANLLLDDIISKAGYRRAPDEPLLSAFPSRAATTDCAAFPAEAAITNIIATATGQTGFCLRYQPALEGEAICDGGTTTLSKNTPFIYPDSSELVYLAIKFTPGGERLDQGVLTCTGAAGTAELIEGIADFRVEFGAGFQDEKRLKSSPYKLAENWTSGDGPVRALRYAVLSASRENQREGESAILTQWLAAASTATKTRLQSQDKRNLYQSAVGGQSIRNMMP